MKPSAPTHKFRFTSIGMLFLALSSMVPGFSQNALPITRMGSVNTRSFDEKWLFSRYGLQADGTYKEEPTGLEMPAVNDSAWRKLDLPHDWAIEGPFRIELKGETGKLPYQGIGWYRKYFFVQADDAGKQTFIDFDGAMANAKIWVNGQYVGTWPYGYSSFRMNLSPFLKYGQKNVLAVRLDTEKWESRWYPGAGIYRHVWLIKTNPVHVAHWGTYITTPEITDGSATVKMEVTLDNQWSVPVEAVIRTNILELDNQNKPGTKVASFDEQAVKIDAGSSAKATIGAKILKPKLWDIVSPSRYVAQTSIRVNGKIVDQYNTPFGIRTLEFTARNGFLLNGRRVPIRGTCNHHDLGALGAAINTSALRRQLSILKDMGCNSLRTSHNPPAPELIELADQMGFLVWDEAFDAWKTGKRKLDYNQLCDEWHEKDLKALVHRDRNNPSVFIWSIGNEVIDQQNVEMTKHLADIVRGEDPTRPVSNGYNDPDGSRTAGSPLSLGIMGVNYFFGNQAKWDADPRYANMPTIGSETSSCITSRGEYFFDKDYQNWQVSSYDLTRPDWGCAPDDQFRVNAKYPHVLGEYVWTGFDYLGEPTPYNSDETNMPSRSSYFGIVDLAGFPKDRFYLYQSQWKPDLPMAHILPHWNWKERIGKVTLVHVYTSGDEAELFINGKSQGRKIKRPGEDFRLVWDSVKYEPGRVEVIAYKNGAKWATDMVKTTGEPFRLSLTSNLKMIGSDEPELAYITVMVQDKQGYMVPRSNPVIKFEISGPGVIVATDNGDATSFIPFQSHERPAFNGLALVIVKARKGAGGKITVTASGKGLQAGSITIDLQQIIRLNE
ncbi:MAG: beta-galactosidase GalB [Bacteroidales bacterium]